MNNTEKTLAGIAAAAAIGGGVYFMTSNTEPALPEDVPAEVEFVDDIEPIRVPVYTVDTWQYESPVEEIKIDLPEIEKLSPEQMKVIAAFVEQIKIEKLSPEQVKALQTIINEISVEALSPEQIKIIFATVESLDGDVYKMQALHKLVAVMMQDKRMIQHDKGLTIYNPGMEAWLEIYSQELPPAIEHIPLPRGIRMIAELRSLDYAAENLAFYQQEGYNACLITIDGTESVDQLLERVRLVRSAGMAAWIAWAGPESLTWSIFQDPKAISRLLKAAAPFCQGYLPAWRRTSAHLVAQDDKYLEHLVAQVRTANPQILVVGESYYGQTWENEPYINQRGWQARDNIARNQSGILIAGIATQNFAIETMLRSTFARWVATPRLAMVLGERAYYASSHNTGRGFLINLRIKQQLERRFLRAGALGSITIHGDGSDRGSSLQATDDIGKYEIVY